MKLYEGPRSSASWRVRWALALKRLPYQSVVIDIASGEHLTALRALTPSPQVPILELDDGRVLTESVAIIEWLEETHPTPALLPSDPWDRARTRELVQLVNAGIHPLQNTHLRQAISGDAAAQTAWAQRWIARGLATYEAHVAARPGRFSVGETLTMADIYLVPQVRNAERYGLELGPYPNVCRIRATCLETVEAQATAPAA